MSGRRVNPGQALGLRAAEFNRWQAAADAVEAGGAARPLGDGAGRAPEYANAVLAVGKNSTEDAIARHDVCRITAPRLTPGASATIWRDVGLYTLDKVANAAGIGWGVALEPIAAGGIGAIAIGGVFPAIISATAAGLPFARPVAGGFGKLDTGHAGPFEVLWQAGGTGAQWALLKGAPEGVHRHQLAEVTASSGSGPWVYTVKLRRPTASGLTDAGFTVANVRNRLELGNTGTGVEFSQVDLTNDAPDGGSLELRAIATGTTVELSLAMGFDGTVYPSFSVHNGVTVTCGGGE